MQTNVRSPALTNHGNRVPRNQHHWEQLGSIARGTATDAGELPRGTELQRLLDAAAGLTRYEAENAFSLSLVRHGKLQVETL